jgi:hypothetical protein
MKRLTSQKRNQLILVAFGTAALISVVYFLLIRPQNDENQKLTAKIVSEQDRLERMKNTINSAATTSSSAADSSVRLAHEEEDLASGDLFAWTYDTIRRFKTGYRVEIPNVGQPAQSEVDLIPGFPYKQIKFSLIGTGYYHDIGKFISDLENKFPHMRVINLMIDSGSGSDSSSEKLSFRIDVAALVKPNA